MNNKIAIMTSVFYPEDSKTKFELVKKVLGTIPDYAGVDYDLFIMNDGTPDERLEEYLLEYKPRDYCKNIYYTSRENKGITKSLNELLNQIDDSYAYICHLDLDVLVPVHWLKKCKQVLDEFDKVGICGVLVEDELNFTFTQGILTTKNNNLFAPVSAIGGACLAFRAKELKSYMWDESLTSDHVDAHIIHTYRKNKKSVCAIIDRGYHPKELYESPEYIKRKYMRYQTELPKFYELHQELKP